jgi:hypothetical protein
MAIAQQSLGALNAATAWVTPSEGFAGQIVFQISGTFSGTLTFQGTVQPTVGTPAVGTIQATKLDDGTAVTTATAAGLFRVDASGLTGVRAKMTAYTSGAALADVLPVIG